MWGRQSFSALPRLFNTPLAVVVSTGAAAAAACMCSDIGDNGNRKKTLAEEWENMKAHKRMRAFHRSYTEHIRVELKSDRPRHFDNPTVLASTVGACSVASNNPNEDRFIRTIVSEQSGVILAAVFDGHGGYHVADYAAAYMPSFIRSIIGEGKSCALAAVLLEAYKCLEGDLLEWTKREIDSLLRHSKMVEEEQLEYDPPKMSVATLTKMQAGACAVSVLLAEDSYCVANVGDCRAMLVRRLIDGHQRSPNSLPLRRIPPHVEVEWLTAAHNADSPIEQEKLKAEHPGEEDLVHCKQKIIELGSDGKTVGTRWGACYVKGRLQPTRALGDFYFKDMDIARAARVAPYPHERSDDDENPFPPFTPPYVSAVPDVRTECRDPTRDMFLIMASDGLWDYLPDPEIVSTAVDVFEREGPQAAAEALVSQVIDQAARSAKLTPNVVRRMQPGRTRRNIHDDVTVVIVKL